MRLVRARIFDVGGKRETVLLILDEVLENGFLYAVHTETGLGVSIRPSDITETIWKSQRSLQ